MLCTLFQVVTSRNNGTDTYQRLLSIFILKHYCYSIFSCTFRFFLSLADNLILFIAWCSSKIFHHLLWKLPPIVKTYFPINVIRLFSNNLPLRLGMEYMCNQPLYVINDTISHNKVLVKKLKNSSENDYWTLGSDVDFRNYIWSTSVRLLREFYDFLKSFAKAIQIKLDTLLTNKWWNKTFKNYDLATSIKELQRAVYILFVIWPVYKMNQSSSLLHTTRKQRWKLTKLVGNANNV